jgi:hypothetical protein
MTTTPRPLAILRWLWLGVAIITVVPAFIMLMGLTALFSARWLQGFTPALALDLLLVLQVALGVALFWRFSHGTRSVLLATAAGAALAVGYAGVLAALPATRGQWIFIVPAAALALGLGTTLAYGIVTRLTERLRA